MTRVRVEDGWIRAGEYAKKHNIPWYILYSAINRGELKYKRVYGGLIIPEATELMYSPRSRDEARNTRRLRHVK